VAVPAFVDHARGRVEDGIPTVAHTVRLGPIGPNVKSWVGATRSR
jgi:hypothetical protein